MSRRILLLALPITVLALPAGTQTIRGRVLDAASGVPVPEVQVSALNASGRTVQRARAGADGGFLLRLRSGGTIRLRGQRTGYGISTSGAMEVGPRDTVAVELRIAEQPLTMDPLTVTARIQPRRIPALMDRGFYAREARGLGDFLHRDDLSRGAPMSLSQVLDRVPGTRLLRGRSGTYLVFDRSAGVGALRRPAGDGACFPKLYLDGIHVSQASGIDVVQPESVEAVELYHGSAQLPAEYNDSDAACGVILVWTRTSA